MMDMSGKMSCYLCSQVLAGGFLYWLLTIQGHSPSLTLADYIQTIVFLIIRFRKGESLSQKMWSIFIYNYFEFLLTIRDVSQGQ